MKKMFKRTCESLGFHIEMAISYRKIPVIYSAPSPPRVTHPIGIPYINQLGVAPSVFQEGATGDSR